MTNLDDLRKAFAIATTAAEDPVMPSGPRVYFSSIANLIWKACGSPNSGKGWVHEVFEKSEGFLEDQNPVFGLLSDIRCSVCYSRFLELSDGKLWHGDREPRDKECRLAGQFFIRPRVQLQPAEKPEDWGK